MVDIQSTCIAYIYYAFQVYDLYSPALHNFTEVGCPDTDQHCQTKDLDGRYCIHGECTATYGVDRKCTCDPGWHGVRCNESK